MAHLFFLVDLQHVSAQQPVGRPIGAAALAGGVVALLHGEAVLVQKVQPRRLSVRARGQQLVAWLQNMALKSLHLHLPFAACVAVARAVDAQMAPGAGGVAHLVVFQPVGLDRQARAAQFGVALQSHALAALPCERIGAHRHGQRRAAGRQGFAQLRRGAQGQRRAAFRALRSRRRTEKSGASQRREA